MSLLLFHGSSPTAQSPEDSSVNPFQLLRSLRATLPVRPGSVHSCPFCSVQELDPSIHVRSESDLYDVAVIKYRGSRCIQGALNGCTLFQEFIAILVRQLITRGYDEHNSTSLIDPERWICQLRSCNSHYSDRLQRAQVIWESSKDQLAPVNPYHMEGLGSLYWLTAEENDPAAETVRPRPFRQTLSSEESRQWVMSRLKACETSHHKCLPQGSNFTPSRLLSLSQCQDGSLSLRLQDMPKGHHRAGASLYTALTYCWGGHQELQLNANTKAALMKGLPISKLPRTLHDAVLETQNLGIKLIWIDCLCIYQDNPQDIALEIAQMPKIYMNSFITISVARANHSNEGFLHDISVPPISETAFRLPFACPDKKLGSVILSKGLANSPIDDRAWTLQEYILSRRVLQYTNAGLHWTCREAVEFRQDDACLALDYLGPFKDSYRMFQGFYESNKGCRNWMNIVEVYTKRELTYALDKLPAISGVAETWAQALDDSYLAGIWLSHLPEALLWTTAQPQRQSKQPAEYVAPTWSWASLFVQVYWFDSTMTTIDPRVVVVCGTTTPIYPEAQYGRVSSGSLVVHGCLQKASLIPSIERSLLVQSESLTNETLDLDFATVMLDFGINVLEDRIRGCTVYCLQICLFDEDSRSGPSGLILITQDEKTFRRIGVFNFEPLELREPQAHGDYVDLFQQYQDMLNIQQRAFCHSNPRTITIV